MDDALFVGRGKRVGKGRGEGDDALDRQAALGDEAVERLPLHDLHCQEVNTLGLFDREHGDDVRVVERGERLRLALEAREPVGIASHLRREHLERHVAPELRVGGAIHFAHAARANRRGDLIVGEGAADQRGTALPLREGRVAMDGGARAAVSYLSLRARACCVCQPRPPRDGCVKVGNSALRRRCRPLACSRQLMKAGADPTTARRKESAAAGQPGERAMRAV
jgi:hypothetical protein